ncbi:uncharacterized protein LOC129947571 [Eupeodes corollae]|uniref:uncharacterized protein LOC129947571 n=1 Tax=Eupeodes corollae TaxID=290404 RepID=UPI002493A3EB|nr:uncharacterized protein LOC129947571 [Eupeodes corollae]
MTQRYQQQIHEAHLISSFPVMKVCMVFLAVLNLNVVNSGFIPPIQERGFMPITHRWQTSLEDSGLGEINQFEPENQHEYDFGDQASDLHLHEDHGQHHYEHFEDSAEEHQPSSPIFEDIRSLPSEDHETKKEKTIHVHEHHHHYHSHYRTLPVSIIKKTVYFKHG